MSSFRPYLRRLLNSMVTIILSKSCESFSFGEIWNSTQIESPEINDDKFFCDSRCLSMLAPVDIGTCYLSGDSFEPKMANLPILMKFCTLHKQSVMNSMVTIVFLWFLTPANIGNCQYWYLLSFRPQFLAKNGKCSSFDKILHFIEN